MFDTATLEPEVLWSIFSFICSIPHRSRDEKALAEAIVVREKSRGIEAYRDKAGNVIVRRPAAKGMEGKRGLILQAHLDMVCQLAAGTVHDFARDPIRPRRDPADPRWLRATGTTLGADDGIGVAAALALIESEDPHRRPLECLFTVNEEDGMDGAFGLEAGELRGDLLVNLDSESAQEICIGCAGSSRIESSLRLPGSGVEARESWVEVSVGGLLGGHSGVDIHLGRGNALRVLAAILRAAMDGGTVARLGAFEGGTVANAIPRSARARLLVPEAAREAWESSLRAAAVKAKAELGKADPGLELGIAPVEGQSPAAVEGQSPAAALDAASTKRLIDFVLSLPIGVLEMSKATPGIPRSSNSLGIAKLEREASGSFVFEATCAPRSEDDAENEKTLVGIERLSTAAGGSARRVSQGIAWPPLPSSPLLAIAREAYRDLNGREAVIGATHGGLETALFRKVYPNWNMISIGPTIRYPHSPDEAVDIASVEDFWKLLVAIAAR